MPKDISPTYLQEAAAHIANFANRVRDFHAVKNEIVAMYRNANHPHFVDFKTWGTPRGPSNTQPGGSYTYFSDAEGASVVSGAFEAFGNFFFGVVCTFAGFPFEATQIATAVSQERGSGFRDDARDVTSRGSWCGRS